MAKGWKTSLAVRGLALLFALALAALAARLWLGGAPRAARQAGEEDEAAGAPPLHEEHSAKDQQALKDILRGAEVEAP